MRNTTQWYWYKLFQVISRHKTTTSFHFDCQWRKLRHVNGSGITETPTLKHTQVEYSAIERCSSRSELIRLTHRTHRLRELTVAESTDKGNKASSNYRRRLCLKTEMSLLWILYMCTVHVTIEERQNKSWAWLTVAVTYVGLEFMWRTEQSAMRLQLNLKRS